MAESGGLRRAGSRHVWRRRPEHRAGSARVGSRACSVEAHKTHRALYTQLPCGGIQSVQSPELRQPEFELLVRSFWTHHFDFEHWPNRDWWHAQNRGNAAAGVLMADAHEGREVG